MEADILIKGGDIVDGTGKAPYQADIAILNGKISRIGTLNDVEAPNTIDGQGMVVCPGFIDIHGHSDITLLACPTADSKVMQGITTEVAGNCGESAAPVSERTIDDTAADAKRFGIEVSWGTMGSFLDMLEGRISINYATLVGLGTIRGGAIGTVDRPATPSELSRMGDMVKEALDEGALGISTGLVYPPGMYADTQEIIELAKCAVSKSGIYASHIRGEGKNLTPAIEEAIQIGREASIPVQISHLKASGEPNWGRMPSILSGIEDASKDGVDVMADRYPYIAGATSLAAIFPGWSHEGGRKAFLTRLRTADHTPNLKKAIDEGIADVGWSKIILTNAWSAQNSELEGKSIAECAARTNTEPYDILVRLILDSGGLASMVSFTQDENDMLITLTHPRVMVGSDCGVKSPEGKLGEGKPHPRCYGTFPKFVNLFVRQKGLLTLEEAMPKMTSMPAERLKLEGRGTLNEGFWADIVVFDPSGIEDTATYQNPHSYPRGIEYVIVNGELVVNKGVHTKAAPGMVLRRRG